MHLIMITKRDWGTWGPSGDNAKKTSPPSVPEPITLEARTLGSLGTAYLKCGQ